MNRRFVLVSCFVLAVGLVGCGKSDTPATDATTAPPVAKVVTPPVSLDQYNQALADLATKVASLQKDMQTGMANAKAAGSKEAGEPIAKAAMDKFVAGCTSAIDDLEKINPPADLAQFHKDAVSWNRKVIDVTKPMIESVVNSDTSKTASMQKDLQTDMQMMLDDYKADLTAAGYDYDAFTKTGKLSKKK